MRTAAGAEPGNRLAITIAFVCVLVGYQASIGLLWRAMGDVDGALQRQQQTADAHSPRPGVALVADAPGKHLALQSGPGAAGSSSPNAMQAAPAPASPAP